MIHRVFLGVAFVVCLVGGCDWTRPRCEGPADLCEYHGDPSSMFCGRRWSNDHTSILCEGARITTDGLQPFTHLKSVRLVDVKLRPGTQPPNQGLQVLHLLRVELIDVDIPERFPAVTSLIIDRTGFDLRALPRMGRLRDLLLVDSDAPEAADVLALRELQVVQFLHLRCGAPDCARTLGQRLLHDRPSLTVRVDGQTLSPIP